VTLQFLTDLPIEALPVALTGGESFVLGGSAIGQLPPGLAPGWPVQRVSARLLGKAQDSLQEIWRCNAPAISGEFDGIVWRRVDDLLFGVLELDEADFAATENASALQAASEAAYRRIFRLLDTQKLPHLWRLWNYIAEINREVNGLERYRQFNVGRQDAFLEFKRGSTGNVPAACAIGLTGGALSIAFMAGATPAVPVENPRQISAYNYPNEYGPRSPTFSRAALVYPPGQEILFISGTASIVGHQTVHPGDVIGQCHEVLVNLAAVIAEANRQCRSAAYGLTELSYRVYLRHADDFAAVRDTLVSVLGASAELVYVEADICRQDLLIEIEAMASHVLGNG
jgi:hypothetical protein